MKRGRGRSLYQRAWRSARDCVMGSETVGPAALTGLRTQGSWFRIEADALEDGLRNEQTEPASNPPSSLSPSKLLLRECKDLRHLGPFVSADSYALPSPLRPALCSSFTCAWLFSTSQAQGSLLKPLKSSLGLSVMGQCGFRVHPTLIRVQKGGRTHLQAPLLLLT